MKYLPAFVHIEKAAGTSVIHLLREAFVGRYLDVRPLCAEGGKYVTADDLHTYRKFWGRPGCIGGHAVAPHADLRSVFPEIRYFSIFRDPAQRFVSQYNYWRDKLGYSESFEDYLVRPDVRNVQTRHIAGNDDVAAAIDIISNEFFMVGILEDLDGVLQMLRSAFEPRLDNTQIPRVNVARHRDSVADKLTNYRDAIVDANSSDFALYERVCSQLIPMFRNRLGVPISGAVGISDTPGRGQPRGGRRAADYVMRKLYLEPVTGLIRLSNGLPYKGSYRHF